MRRPANFKLLDSHSRSLNRGGMGQSVSFRESVYQGLPSFGGTVAEMRCKMQIRRLTGSGPK